jgi:hypothetical protein
VATMKVKAKLNSDEIGVKPLDDGNFETTVMTSNTHGDDDDDDDERNGNNGQQVQIVFTSKKLSFAMVVASSSLCTG